MTGDHGRTRARVRQWGVMVPVIGVLTTAGLLCAGGVAQAATAPPKDYSFTATGATLADVRRITRDDVAASRGWTGKGIGIALIDTGVAPVDGLTSGNVVNGPDLSFESQAPNLQWRDTYGHGTHMAGIIAGRGTGFTGMAPDAKLTSIKVGTANGAVDVTQVMAAIDWVVAHRNDDPANPIRVLNLSYGTSGLVPTQTNPMSLAVQNAHRAGIAVVVASGNTGGNVMNPAFDPYVITVAATDMQGTTSYTDDKLASFSSVGGSEMVTRTPDLLLPGKSIVSLRDPGSYVDVSYPSARVGDRFFVGSGTSQAAAAATGAVAVLLQRYPALTPDAAKCSLVNTGTAVAGSTIYGRMIDLDKATSTAAASCTATGTASQGNGSIQTSRGTSIVTMNGVALTGERDIFGPLSSSTWAVASKAGTAWQGGSWMGHPMTGTGWGPTTYGQPSWAGRAWSGASWTGRAWSDIAWAGATWTGRAWSNATVNGVAWAGRAWSGVSWQSAGNGNWMP